MVGGDSLLLFHGNLPPSILGTIVLCLTSEKDLVFTGASDKLAKIWRFSAQVEDLNLLPKTHPSMLQCLKQFIRFKSVSSDPALSQESRRCAKFLRDVFAQHGAQTKMASGQEGKNPLVLAKFIGQEVGFPLHLRLR